MDLNCYEKFLDDDKNLINNIYKKYRNIEKSVAGLKINLNNRKILILWLIEVCRVWKLLPATLCLTISIIDRFLEKETIKSKNNLQLLGATALFLAYKYEERPEINFFVDITDCITECTKDEIVLMEIKILFVIDFNLSAPTTNTFLIIYYELLQTDFVTKMLCNELNQRLLLEYSMLKYKPSLIAASVICVILNDNVMKIENLIECIKEIKLLM